jgi:hypothetical protein
MDASLQVLQKERSPLDGSKWSALVALTGRAAGNLTNLKPESGQLDQPARLSEEKT